MVRIDDIDWTTWRPTDVATLLFVIVDDRILLIRKKRGLGAGKINGPGGRLEPGETPREAAIREVEEELCITPHEPHRSGELRFQFVDGYALHVHVFRAGAFHGRPTETEEATPLWHPLERMPYEEMWADDPLWLPHLVAGRLFDGRFTFDRDELLDHRLELGGTGIT